MPRDDLDAETKAKFSAAAAKAFEVLSNRAYGKPVQEEARPPAGIKFVVIGNQLPNSEVIDWESTQKQPLKPSFALPEAKVISSEIPKVEEKRPETKTETKAKDSGSDFFVAPAYKR